MLASTMPNTLLRSGFLLLLLCWCGTANLAKYPMVNVPPFPDGETCLYRVLVDGEEVGSYTMTVRRAEFRGLPVFRLDLVLRTAVASGMTVDSSIVYVTRDSMVPVSSFHFNRTEDILTTTAANYTSELVAIASYDPQGDRQRVLPFGPFTYDSDQLTFLARALMVPNTGKPVEITVISPMGPPAGGGAIGGRLGVSTSERTSVPAGTFDCTRLIFNLGPRVIAIWVEKTGYRRMVRYVSSSGNVVMELLPPAALVPTRP
jgi:hypothetical protein